MTCIGKCCFTFGTSPSGSGDIIVFAAIAIMLLLSNNTEATTNVVVHAIACYRAQSPESSYSSYVFGWEKLGDLIGYCVCVCELI